MGYGVQDQNENAKVKAFGGNTDSRTGQPQTDIIISEPGYPNEHRHIVLDVNGNQVYDQYNQNH